MYPISKSLGNEILASMAKVKIYKGLLGGQNDVLYDNTITKKYYWIDNHPLLNMKETAMLKITSMDSDSSKASTERIYISRKERTNGT